MSNPTSQPVAGVVQLDEAAAVPCPCGTARRATVAGGAASVHLVDISTDSATHHHERQTEVYLVLEGEGFVELDGVRHALRPMSLVTIPPGCRHRAVGNLKIVNLCLPAFDPSDEHLEA